MESAGWARAMNTYSILHKAYGPKTAEWGEFFSNVLNAYSLLHIMRIKGQDYALSGLAPGCLFLPGGYALPLTYYAPLGLVV